MQNADNGDTIRICRPKVERKKYHCLINWLYGSSVGGVIDRVAGPHWKSSEKESQKSPFDRLNALS